MQRFKVERSCKALQFILAHSQWMELSKGILMNDKQLGLILVPLKLHQIAEAKDGDVVEVTPMELHPQAQMQTYREQDDFLEAFQNGFLADWVKTQMEKP